MATRFNEGAVQVAPNVLAFPIRNKGRVRKSRSIGSMGRCSLHRPGHDGTIPGNVVDYDPERRTRDESLPERTDAMMLAAALFAVLAPEQKRGVRDALLFLDRNGDRTAQRLWNFLDRGGKHG